MSHDVKMAQPSTCAKVDYATFRAPGVNLPGKSMTESASSNVFELEFDFKIRMLKVTGKGQTVHIPDVNITSITFA